VTDDRKPIANPLVVLREEFDDWAILFDPDTGNAFGLNPVGVFVWKLLDGEHAVVDIVREIHGGMEDVSPEAHSHIDLFVQDLIKQGLAGYEIQTPMNAGTMEYME
jgi:SynChlorMet cassette protein ScmD